MRTTVEPVRNRPNNVGKRRPITTISGRTIHFVVADEVVLESGSDKLIFFQKLRFEEDRRIEYRFGYYMRGYKASRRGQWIWGQYCLMLSERELTTLLKRARAKGWKGI